MVLDGINCKRLEYRSAELLSYLTACHGHWSVGRSTGLQGQDEVVP